MLLASRLLRFVIFGFCIYVLSGIVPISVAQWQGQGACPLLGPLPACYVVSASYLAMAIASILWSASLTWLFLAGVAPVILLAASGTFLELSGRPTCPRSATDVALCFYSLAVGLGMLAIFLCSLFLELQGARKR